MCWFFQSLSSVLQTVLHGQTIPKLQQAQRELFGYTNKVVEIDRVWIKTQNSCILVRQKDICSQT